MEFEKEFIDAVRDIKEEDISKLVNNDKNFITDSWLDNYLFFIHGHNPLVDKVKALEKELSDIRKDHKKLRLKVRSYSIKRTIE